MHSRKREYEPKKHSSKKINCVNCDNIIAEGNIRHGVIEIVCHKCKTRNKLEAIPRAAEGEVKVMSDIYSERRVRAAYA